MYKMCVSSCLGNVAISFKRFIIIGPIKSALSSGSPKRKPTVVFGISAKRFTTSIEGFTSSLSYFPIMERCTSICLVSFTCEKLFAFLASLNFHRKHPYFSCLWYQKRVYTTLLCKFSIKNGVIDVMDKINAIF